MKLFYLILTLSYLHLKTKTILELTRRKNSGGLNHPLKIDSKEGQKFPVLKSLVFLSRSYFSIKLLIDNMILYNQTNI